VGTRRDAPRALAATVDRSLRELDARGRLLATPHLPQGAPTSPALANLSAYRLDCRLAGLADAFGAIYSRYADDLAFSGGTAVLSRAPWLRWAVAAIVAAEGFRLNERKAALAIRAGRQRVCGIVVNARTNAPRDDYDRLRAALHEAATRGPAAANRDRVPDLRAHLLGRIGWVEALSPARGTRLRRTFAAIDWSREYAVPGTGYARPERSDPPNGV
jgi:RNA-directed DNA polymerase